MILNLHTNINWSRRISKIILNINEKDKCGYSSLLLVINNNNIEKVKILMDYKNTHHIILYFTNIDLWNSYETKLEILKLIVKYSNSKIFKW